VDEKRIFLKKSVESRKKELTKGGNINIEYS